MASIINKIYRSFLAPRDPSLLGYVRIAYGLLMTFDLVIERGMPYMDRRWGDDNDNCRFPLIHGMEPANYDIIASLHGLMAISIMMVTIGFFTKFFNFIFMMGYWYIFILGKETWNNHSYMFGLFSFILLCSDSNHYLSVDSWLWPKKYRNKHVPAIQYSVLRLQIFILYFYAGIKKFDQDWLDGYSMGKLSRYWVFDSIKTAGEFAGFERDTVTHLIDQFFIHTGGFLLDLLGGFILYFDKTRYLGFLQMLAFHGLNSQMFSIGIFSYTCIATMFVFCYDDSFRKLVRDPSKAVPDYNLCIYDNIKIEDEPTEEKPSDEDTVEKEENPKKPKVSKIEKRGQRISMMNYIKVSIVFLYMGCQLFLPFSHFITKGYNGWTQGTYGYSWDMMIHSFSTQHIKIRFVNPITGEDGYLKPDAFTSGRASSRWTQHPDQLWQYAHCLKEKLIILDVGTEDQPPEIYFDVWKTMNKRFNQRVYKSDVNILEAGWKWNEDPSFTLPLLSGYNDWRPRIREMGKNMMNQSEYTEVTFIADFPGMFLENFLNSDLGNTTIEVLDGIVEVELLDQEGTPRSQLTSGERMSLPADQFHNVHVTGDNPACYMYIYENTTHKVMVEGVKKLEMKLEELKIVNVTEYTPEKEEEPYYAIILERYKQIEGYAKEAGVDLNDLRASAEDADGASTDAAGATDATSDASVAAGEDDGVATDDVVATSDDRPSDSKGKSEDQAGDAGAASDDSSSDSVGTSEDQPGTVSDSATEDGGDSANDGTAATKEQPARPVSVEEGFFSDKVMRIIERKASLFVRSYRLAKFGVGALIFNWKPDFEEHMSLDEPNFVVPDHWYRNEDYAKSRIRRREKFAEYVQAQLKHIVESYEYDADGNLVPKDETEDGQQSTDPDDADSLEADEDVTVDGDESGVKTEL